MNRFMTSTSWSVNTTDLLSNLHVPVPCSPTNLTARDDCGTNMGTLTWAPRVHAISYTATVTGTHGHVSSCSSNTTTCLVKLDCGRRYTADVIASSATCNSSTGASLTFDSGIEYERMSRLSTFSLKWLIVHLSSCLQLLVYLIEWKQSWTVTSTPLLWRGGGASVTLTLTLPLPLVMIAVVQPVTPPTQTAPSRT